MLCNQLEALCVCGFLIRILINTEVSNCNVTLFWTLGINDLFTLKFCVLLTSQSLNVPDKSKIAHTVHVNKRASVSDKHKVVYDPVSIVPADPGLHSTCIRADCIVC